jgi:phosphoglycolate phosphatase
MVMADSSAMNNERQKNTPKSTRQSVIFDLDGTLIDSAPSILAGFAATLEQHQLSPQVALTERLIGPPLLQTLQTISGVADADLLASLAQGFKDFYDTSGYQQSVVYPGVMELLETLAKANFALHLATNKRILPTERIVEYFGWAPLFTSVYALDKATPAYPDKASMIAAQMQHQGLFAAATHYVGDTLADGKASAANKVAFIAADWGYGDLSSLRSNTADSGIQLAGMADKPLDVAAVLSTVLAL